MSASIKYDAASGRFLVRSVVKGKTDTKVVPIDALRSIGDHDINVLIEVAMHFHDRSHPLHSVQRPTYRRAA